ncbi:hypothetical protein DH09_13710 [Bacillaceae bacterium JMAK1]|nr:hypothetical protein DH09_13710 [Bacillaceae bacterium JMAK1]
MQWIVKQLMDECPELELFIQNHRELFEQPIMQHFLSSPQARNLFIQSIREPTDTNQQRLDDHFQSFYLNAQFTRYVSKTLYWTAIQYDQKRRKQRARNPLIVDNPSVTDYTIAVEPDYSIVCETLDVQSWSSNPRLSHALTKLTPQQKKILIGYYKFELTNQEIADQLNVSQQAVSRMRLSTIRFLQNVMKEGTGND